MSPDQANRAQAEEQIKALEVIFYYVNVYLVFSSHEIAKETFLFYYQSQNSCIIKH